jgi:response regulator RpfG family c-di-GMP phosphodiesterase
MNAAENELPTQVLFVDDEENIIKALRRLFMDEDFEVLTATSGEEGLAVIRSNNNIGLIVSDQRMPGMTGVDFLAEARKLAPDALRIVLTGYADINAAMGAINKGGAFRYLTKPWQDDEIGQNIREAIKIFRLKKENDRLHEIVQQQNSMLEEWNSSLKTRILEQTRDIRQKNETLHTLNTRLRKNFNGSILAFSNLLELRDKSVGSHAVKVAELSERVALAKGMSVEEVETIRIAALLHDVGKIGISDQVLLKNKQELSDEESAEYRQHSVRGQAAIDAIEDLRDAGILIRHHHERFDGQGWPDQLQGDVIPIGARIIGMADMLDREIKTTLSADIVTSGLARLRKGLDRILDPDLYPFLEKAAREVYATYVPEEAMEVVERTPEELHEGTILAKNIVSGTGILLLGKGSELDENSIRAISRYYMIDPPREGIFILEKVKKSQPGQDMGR